MIRFNLLFCPLVFLLMLSCTPSKDSPITLVDSIPNEFNENFENGEVCSYWWLEFEDEQLNKLVSLALENNYSIKAHLSRIKQVEALSNQQRSLLFPSINSSISGGTNYNDSSSESSGFTFKDSTGVLSLSPSISWELDLFGKLYNQKKGADEDIYATIEEKQSLVLSLIGKLCNTYFQLLGTEYSIARLEEQIETSRAFLRIVQLKYVSSGENSLNVTRQEQQLESVQRFLPTLLAKKEILKHQILVLIGQAPEETFPINIANNFPKLIHKPNLGTPKDLLFSRPDLKFLLHKIYANEHRLYFAILDFIPSLSFNYSANFSASSIGSMFTTRSFSTLGSLFIPIFNGGKKIAIASQKKAILEESVHNLNHSFLVACEELESSVKEEIGEKNTLNSLEKGIKLAKENLIKVKSRYSHGVIDYLDVLTALSSLQSLERSEVEVKTRLYLTRTKLLLALGKTPPHRG